MIGNCRKCNARANLKAGLCEDCASNEEAKRMEDVLGVRKKKTPEEIQRELELRKKDKRFWWGGKQGE